MDNPLSSMSWLEILILSLGIVLGITLTCLFVVGLVKSRSTATSPLRFSELRSYLREFLIQGFAILVLTVILLWVARALGKSIHEPPDMVTVPAGAFFMGASNQDILWAAEKFHSESLEYYQDETPSHSRRLPAFDLDRLEVTVTQYRKFMEATDRAAPRYFDNEKFNRDDQPVVGVTWKDAADYCVWAGKRLPTEAEWEKAARGTDGRYYPWGNDPDPKRANVRGKEDGYRYSAKVGSFPQGASPYGILDLTGNVWEWTGDWYQPHPGNHTPNDLYGKKFRVIKGGSWFSNLDLGRATVRGKALPDQEMNYIGFRCARSAAKE